MSGGRGMNKKRGGGVPRKRKWGIFYLGMGKERVDHSRKTGSIESQKSLKVKKTRRKREELGIGKTHQVPKRRGWSPGREGEEKEINKGKECRPMGLLRK